MSAMAPRSTMQLHLRRACICVLLLFAAAAYWSVPPALSQSIPGCPGLTPSGPPTNRTIHIAIMFWGPPLVNGTRQEVWPRNPILDGWNGPTSTDLMILRSYLLWEEKMRLPAAYGTKPGLILLDGSILKFNITWFHSGVIDDLDRLDEYAPGTAGSWPDRLVHRLANATGPYGRQHFVITPLPSHAAITMLASLACEATQSCITVAAAAPNTRMMVCQDPMPIDCITRGRRDGSRRFEYTVSPASNGDYWGSGSLAFAVNQGIKRIFIVAEPWALAVITQLRGTAAQLGLEVVGVQMVEAFGTDWAALNTSMVEVTDQMRGLEVDFAVFVSAFNTPTLPQLIEYWKQIDYLPAAVAFLAGGAAFLTEDIRSYIMLETFWLPQLTGALFHAVRTDTNFETFPANATNDSPAIFADAYRTRFKVQVPLSTFYQAARSFHAVTIVQKLLELAQTEDIELVRYASTRIAAPGVYRTVQFDQWGRSLLFDNYVLQFMPDGSSRVLTPLSLGAPPILPIPGWSEREYKSVFLERENDRIAFGLTAVTVAYIIGWLLWLTWQRRHPLIRVADPLFSAFSLCGLIVLSSACFFSTFWQSDSTCAAFEWLFILGLTLSFAPLVLKNLRIWSLWHNAAAFTPAPIRQWHTVCALFALLLVDIALLTAWQVNTGFLAYRESPDPYRPSLDYYTCDVYAHSRGFVIAAMSWKLLMLALAMYLAYLLRNVSSKYSESRFIALCVYNVTVVLAIFVPVSATNAAGHEGTYLVRNYLLLFLCVSTASIMFVPKFLAIQRSPLSARKNVSWHKNDTRAENNSGSPNDPQQQPPHQSHQSHQSHPIRPQQQTQQRPATEPHLVNQSAVHSAHFPASAPPVNGNGQRGVDFRTPEWPPAQLPAFQSMLGLSQIERRYAEEESVLDQSLDQRSDADTDAAHGRDPRRDAGVEMTSPAPLLAALPPLPHPPQSQRHFPPSKKDSASPVQLLRSTVEMLGDLPSDELQQLHSSLLRRRPQSSSASSASSNRSIPPSAARLSSLSSLSSSAVASLTDSVILHGSTRSGSSGSAITSSIGSGATSVGSASASSTDAMGSHQEAANARYRGGSAVEREMREAFNSEEEQNVVSFYEE